MTEEESNELSVQTIDAKGNAPKRRIATPAALQSAYWTSVNANIIRDRRFAEIAGLNAGFAPTPPDVMERNGQADMPNVNLKQFTAKVKTYADTWNAVNSTGGGWAEVQVEHDDPMIAKQNSEYLTNCFNDAIKSWDNTGFCNGGQYVYESAVRDMQMALFGIGVVMFNDAIDFRWKPITTRRVLVPEGTRLCMDNCPAVFIEDNMSVSQLYGMRDKGGWNKEAILRALYDRVEKMPATSARRASYAEWVNSIINNDAYIISDFRPVTIVHAYVMEFDETISHSIITDTSPGQKAAKKGETSDTTAAGFLFDEEKVAKKWQEVIIPFADNSGPEGEWNGVKGFGDNIFDGCHNCNLMFNAAARAAIVSNTLIFKGLNEGDERKLDQITITPMGIMHPGLEIEQVQLRGDPNSALLIFGTGTNIMDSNSRMFPQNQKEAGGDQPTATQVNFDRADQAQFTNLQVALYRSVGLDVLLSEMYKRLAQPASKYPVSWPGGEVAKKFREKAKAHGIPEADLLKVKLVRANRNGGTGNMGLDVMKAEKVMAVATPGQGQLNARKGLCAAVVGWDNVGAYIEEVEPAPNSEDVVIDGDNLFIQGGKTPTAFGWQPHEKHLAAHMGLLGQIQQLALQMDEAGITPQNLEDAQKLLAALGAGITHSGQHVEFMASMPSVNGRPSLFEQFVKETSKALQNLQKFTQSFAEKVMEAQAQEQPTQMTPEMAKAQVEIQIMQERWAVEKAILEDKANVKLGTSAITNQAKTDMKVQDHQLKLTQKQMDHQQQLAANSDKTAQEIVIRGVEASQKIAEQEKKAAAAPTE